MGKKCNVIAVWHDIAGEITFSKFWVAICILLAMCVLFCSFSFLCNSQGLEGHATEWLKAFTVLVWAVWRESNRDGETHVISLESHSHIMPEGHWEGVQNPTKSVALWEGIPWLIIKTCNPEGREPEQSNSCSLFLPAPNLLPCLPLLNPVGKQRARETGWHSPHWLATQGTEHAEYMELVGQTEC